MTSLDFALWVASGAFGYVLGRITRAGEAVACSKCGGIHVLPCSELRLPMPRCRPPRMDDTRGNVMAPPPSPPGSPLPPRPTK